MTWEEIARIIQAVPADHQSFTADDLRHLKPSAVSDEVFDALIERMKGTNPDNQVDMEFIETQHAIIDACEAKAREWGYASLEDMWKTEVPLVEQALDQEDGAVCATVKIQISQQLYRFILHRA